MRHRRTAIRGTGNRIAITGLVVAGVSMAAAVALVAVVIATGGRALGVVSAPAHVAEPGPGQQAPVSVPASQGAPVAHVAPQPPVAGQPLHLEIPSIGLRANVGAMHVGRTRAIDPPTPGSAYWISDFGIAGPASDGTAYIAGHTYRGGSAVFNKLLDVPHSGVTVHAGDAILVTTPEGVAHYTVTGTALYDKVSVGDQSQLWQKVPGRLVLVTCFQYNGGTSSSQNLVVYSQLDGGPPGG